MIKTFKNKLSGNFSFHSLKYSCLVGFVIFLFLPQSGFSQQFPEYAKTDSTTFALYEKLQWDELIEVGEAAIKNGIDFYYLRMRLGIARYEQHNYRHAIPHFENALKVYPEDQVAAWYLYYSYLFAGRSSDSRRIIPLLNETTKASMGLAKTSILNEIYFEGGPAVSDISTLKQNWQNPAASDTIYSSTTYFKGYDYYHGGIRLNILPSLSIYQGYGLLNASAQQNIRDFDTTYKPFKRVARQDEYYGNLELSLKKGFKITGAAHFFWIGYDRRDYDASVYPPMLDTVAVSEDDYVLSVSVLKEFSFGSLNIGGTYGRLDNDTISQLEASFAYFPFGNINFYGATGIVNLWDNDGYRTIFTQEIGGRIFKNIWFEGNVTIGQLQNYAEKNAFVVYNAPEEINNKMEAVLIYAAPKHLEISLRYRYLERESGSLVYKNFDDFEITKTSYPFHSIIGGIKWKF